MFFIDSRRPISVSMVKILLITHRYYPDIGGIESVSHMLSDSFHRAGYDVRVITWTAETGTKTFPYRIVRNPTLGQIIAQLKWADVVFENNPSLRMSWPNLVIDKPHVTALHTWISRPTGEKKLVDHLKLSLLNRSDIVTACSTAMKENCYPKAVVVTNPYDDKTFRRIDSVKRNKDLVFLGRLVSDKGATILVQAFHQILTNERRRGTSSIRTLTIIGDGPERAQLEADVARFGIGEHVTFTGSLRDEALTRELNKHRCMVIPSLWQEPFGVVALEGMACGCIPIVSKVGGLPDAIGNAGLTFMRGAVDSLVDAIYSIFDNPSFEVELRQLAIAHLAAHHQDVIAGKYLALVEQALKHHKRTHTNDPLRQVDTV